MLGNIISAGASILGGILGSKEADKAREAQAQHLAQQAALQKEFAQHGIKWRVEDAKRAGIHPIYALGSSGATYTPSSAAFAADTSLPSALAAAGQDIGRAVNATRTQTERVSAFTQAAQGLALEKGKLENEALRLEIASKAGRLRQEAAPAFPGNNYLLPGQAQSGAVGPKESPLERVVSAPGAPHQEHAAIPDVGFARTRSGLAPVPSKDVKERIEDNFIQEALWAWRNNIMPSGGWVDNPALKPRDGYMWVYNPLAQEYQEFKRPKKAPFSWIPKFEFTGRR